MVNEARVEVVEKILNNHYTATIVANSLCERLATELATYAEMLVVNGDEFQQVAGLHKAIQILRNRTEQI